MMMTNARRIFAAIPRLVEQLNRSRGNTKYSQKMCSSRFFKSL